MNENLAPDAATETTLQAVLAALGSGPTGLATEATLALVQIDTSNMATILGTNLDVALSTRLKAADTLAGVTTVGAVTSITNPVAVTGTFWQATQPVSGAFYQATQPISAAALPLPSGAATEATLGTLALHSDLVTLNAKDFATQTTLATLLKPADTLAAVTTIGSITNPVAVTGTFWQATQPVSGTVTANAGTNLNTSLLALEAGGNLAAVATSLAIMDDWDESDRAKVNPIAGQAGVAGGSGVVTALTQRVTLATDVALPTGSNVIGAVTQSGTWNVGTVTTLTGITNTVIVAGAKTNNNAAPGATNIGALVAVANAAAPTQTEGNLVALRTTLSGDLAVTLDAEAVVLGAGSAVIGHVILDSGTTAVTYATTGSGTATGALRVELASNGTGRLATVDTITAVTTVSTLTSITNTVTTNVAQMNGVTVTMGNGASGTGVQRVTIANDSTGIIALTTGSAQIGHLEANQSVNVAQMNGVTVLMGNGASGTGAQRVTIANDSTGQVAIANQAAAAATTMQNAAVANGNGTNLDVSKYSVAIVSITASPAMSGGTTINFEASVDDTTFVSIYGIKVGADTVTTTTTTSGDYSFNVSGYKSLRARISAYSAGTVTIKGYPSTIGNNQPVTNAGGTVSATNFPTTVDTNNGVVSASTLRVTLASDSTGQVKLAAGVAAIGTVAVSNLPTTADVNLGASGASTLRVAANLGLAGVAVSAGQGATSSTATIRTDSNMSIAGVTVSAGLGATSSTATLRTDSNLSFAGVAASTSTGASGTGTLRVDANNSIAGVAVSSGNGASGTGTFRVTIANDSTGIIALTTSTAQIGHLEANQSTNVAQINGVTPLMGNGASGTGALRVSIANDSTGIISLTTSTASIGKLAANAGVNIGTVTVSNLPTTQDTNTGASSASTVRVDANNSIAGVAVSSGNGASGTGTARVTIASDSTGQVKLTTATARTFVGNIDTEGTRATYSCANWASVAAGVIVEFKGSATKTITITRIAVNGYSGAGAGTIRFDITRRTAAATGGTSTTPAIIAHYKADAAATGVVKSFTVAPTAGALEALIRNHWVFTPAAGVANTIEKVWDFCNRGEKGIRLANANEYLCIELSNAIDHCGFEITWTEE